MLFYRSNFFQDVIVGMQFGRFGREDGALIMVTKGAKILAYFLHGFTRAMVLILPFFRLKLFR